MATDRDELKDEARRHRIPLIGMAAVVVFGVLLIIYWLAEEAAFSHPPEPVTGQTADQPAAEAATSGEPTSAP